MNVSRERLVELFNAEQRLILQEKTIATMKEALEWYADPINYIVKIHYDHSGRPVSSFNPISECGDRARKALKQTL